MSHYPWAYAMSASRGPAIMLAALLIQGCQTAAAPAAKAPPPAPAATAQPPAAVAAAPDAPAALALALRERLGVAARLKVSGERSEGAWTFVCGRPVGPDGKAIDYARTSLRDQAAQGMAEDQACALLEHTPAGVLVQELAVGATDAPFVDWPERYGIPASILAIGRSGPASAVPYR